MIIQDFGDHPHSSKNPTSKAVFLDRDGVLNVDNGYTFEISNLDIPHDVPAGLRALSEAGFQLIVVTNQSGLARGFFDEEQLLQFHTELRKRIAEKSGIYLDFFLICPHHPNGLVVPLAQHCNCRKPKPGMLDKAIKWFDLDPSKCFMIGDKISDVELAFTRNLKAIQIKTRYPLHDNANQQVGVFAEAVEFITTRNE